MKKRVLSALLAICLTLSLAGAAFAENETSGDSSSAASQAVSSVESEPQTQDETVSSGSVSGEDQTAAKTESTPAPTETPAASDVAEEEPESTPEPEAATEPDTTPAPTEDPVADVTENEESDGSVEYTATLETDGETMNVIVTAPEGAFAEDVQPELSVTMLTAEDELNAVADKLDTAEVQYDGFTALDITFTDEATGEEVEPVKSVAVRIELPQAIVDSGIDLTTLAVQHLEEDENGNVQNVTEVATLDNGITLSEEAAAAANEAAGVAPMSNMPAEEATAGDATETPAAVAEFEVNGFSSFTITWEGTGLHQDGTIEVTYWNTEGNGSDLAVPDQYLFRINKLNDGDSITLQNGKLTVNSREYEIPQQVTVGNDTYKYIGAKCYYDNRWKDFTTIKASPKKIGWNYEVDDHGFGSKPDIRLLYRKVDSSTTDPGGTTVTNATVTTTKTADLKDDGSGNYDLTLSISGDRGSATEKAAVDVLFIVDRSASMTNSGSKRLANAKTAMKTLVNSLEGNENIDAQYSIVTFSGSTKSQESGSPNDASVRMDWTKVSGNNVSNSIDGINSSGGTNYEAGLDKGITQLRTARSNAVKVVIFLSDGDPTWSNKYGNGGAALCREWHGDSLYHTCTYQGWVDTLNKASQISCGYFYAISLGGEASDYMKDLVSKVNASTKQTIEAESDGSNLTDWFKDITADVTFFAATDVTITDPLSEYADLVLDADNNPQFTITVQRAASEGVTDETWSTKQPVRNNGTLSFRSLDNKSITVTAQYDTDKKAIVLNFPDDYELEPGYTYSISTVITPSETAKDLGMNNPAAQRTPDDNTGTHSVKDEDGNKQRGFWSNDNDNAKVTFTANDEPGAQAFPKPVIQVTEEPTGSLQIVKDVQGIDGDVTAVVGNTTFTFKLEKVIPAEGGNDEYTLDDAFTDSTLGFTGRVKDNITITGKGQSDVINGLPEGWYRVTETNTGTVAVDSDYEFVSNNGPVVVEVTKDNTSDAPVEATITNTYKHKDKILTVKKIVAGTMATDGDTFNFTLALTDKNGNPYTGKIPENNKLFTGSKEGEYTFTLIGKMTTPDSLDITLPYNVCATVTEAEAEGYTKVEHREYATGTDPENFAGGSDSDKVTMSQNNTIEFRNTKDLVGPPTGLERNDTPYALMISVAVMAGLALVGGVVVRRRRRWME